MSAPMTELTPAVLLLDEYVGYLDLRTGALELFADETEGASP